MSRQFANVIFALLVAFAFGWGLGSYIAWDVDPGHWTPDGRTADAVVIVIACILIFIALRIVPQRQAGRVAKADRGPRA